MSFEVEDGVEIVRVYKNNPRLKAKVLRSLSLRNRLKKLPSVFPIQSISSRNTFS
jgi:hypothetical protein